jgi:hypothetical protein
MYTTVFIHKSCCRAVQENHTMHAVRRHQLTPKFAKWGDTVRHSVLGCKHHSRRTMHGVNLVQC